MRPMRQFNSVVLPTPLRPIRLTHVPFGSDKSMSHSVWLWPYDWFSLAMVRISLTEVHLDHAGIVLHLVHRALGQHMALVEHGDLAGDRAHELHVVLDDDDGVRAG